MIIVMEIGSPFGEFSVVQEQGGRLQQNNIVTPSVTRDIAETKNVAPVTQGQIYRVLLSPLSERPVIV
jgi:hypothetical protein